MRRVVRLFVLCAWAIAAACVEFARLVPAIAEAVNSLRLGHVRSLLHGLKRLFIWVIQQTVPILYCLYFEFACKRDLPKDEKPLDLSEANRLYLEVELDDLEKSHEIELARRAPVLQRVQGNAATIAVLTGLFAGGLVLLKENPFKDSDSLHTLVPVMLTCAVVWLGMSGFSAIRAVLPHPQCDHWLETRLSAGAVDKTDDAKKAKLVKMILLNQVYTRILTNYATASHISMRNAYAVMGGIVLAILWLR